MAELKRFLCLTVYGEGLPIAWQLQKEGVEVFASIIPDLGDTAVEGEKSKKEKKDENEKRISLFDGLIEKVSPEELVRIAGDSDPDSTFVLCDFNSTWKWAQRLKESGLPGIYPTEQDRKYEVDRESAKEFIRENYPDVEVAEEHEFKTVEEALKFLEGSDGLFVIKGYDEGAPTFVPDASDEEMAKKSVEHKLEEQKSEYEKGGFILEKLIKNPIELTPQAWFVDGELVATSLDIENKRLAAEDKGFMTGASADLVFETSLEDEINKIAFPSIVHDMAKEHGGVFIWDLSLLFDLEDGKAYAGEFCPNRPGYNCFYTELAHREEKRSFFEALMASKSPYDAKERLFSVSTRLFNFRPSDGHLEVSEGKKVEVSDEAAGSFWPMDVKAEVEEDSEDEGEEMVTVGYDYQLGVVTGSGDTIREAVEAMKTNIDGVLFDDKVFRGENDFLSTDYPTSIINRYKYGTKKNLFKPV